MRQSKKSHNEDFDLLRCFFTKQNIQFICFIEVQKTFKILTRDRMYGKVMIGYNNKLSNTTTTLSTTFNLLEEVKYNFNNLYC